MKSNTFSHKEHLRKPAEFKKVYQYGCFKKNHFFLIYYLPNSLNYNRVGISISKKKCVNIVMRNRIKRLIKEVYRLHKHRFGTGFDFIFVVKNRPKHLNYHIFAEIILNQVKCGIQ
ncbi:MAG: ribonuclease P protein component [Candidatus Omnitrophota bacterium]|nr:MAG: ribonuclease P protein component [Candidatus Omnitrophota bacterium]